MLKFSVGKLLSAKGIVSRTGYLRKMGFSFHVARLIVSDDMGTLQLKTLEQLCVLLNCTPNDLLSYVPGKEAIPADHPLRALNDDRYRNEFEEGIQQLNKAELEILREQLRSLLAAKKDAE